MSYLKFRDLCEELRIGSVIKCRLYFNRVSGLHILLLLELDLLIVFYKATVELTFISWVGFVLRALVVLVRLHLNDLFSQGTDRFHGL